MTEQSLRGIRTATLLSTRTVFDKHIAPEPAARVVSLTTRELGTFRVQDAHDLFTAMGAGGSTVHTVIRVAHTFKILLNFACDREWIDRNPAAPPKQQTPLPSLASRPSYRIDEAAPSARVRRDREGERAGKVLLLHGLA